MQTEGVNLAKMAIICSLVILVIGSGMTIWYLMEDHTSDFERNMERATDSAVSEKLYQLSEQSTTADRLGTPTNPNTQQVIQGHPLVTTVAGTLSEYAEDDLLFVYVQYGDHPSTGDLYTYEGVVVDTAADAHFANYAPSISQHQSTRPITDAVKKLLTYSQKRCHVNRLEVVHNGNTLVGVAVEVLE